MANSKLLFFMIIILNLHFVTKDKIVLDRDIEINNHIYYADGKFITNCLCEEKNFVCFDIQTVKLPLLDGKAGSFFLYSYPNCGMGIRIVLLLAKRI